MEIIDKWRFFGFSFVMVAPIQYLIVGFIAMYFYSGGTLYNFSQPGFTFWGNYFSDLGRIVALSGESNLVSFIIFTPSALIFSFSFIPFILLMPSFFKTHRNYHVIAKLGSIAGMFATIFLIITILTPWDIFGNIHLLFATLFNIAGCFISLFYFIAIIKEESFPNLYGITFLILLILAIIYILLTFTTTHLPINEKVILQASYQKISQYSLLFCYFLQGYKGFRLSVEI